MLVHFISDPNQFVLHTYAASSIERLLTVRDPATNQTRFGRASLNPYLQHILQATFSILERPNYPENDYLMKLIMRVLNVSKGDIVPYTDTVLEKLTAILKKICANPSNPIFSHYLFEALSVTIANVAESNPNSIEQFENRLFPPFQSVLSQDVEALSPYVYQVMAQMLELRPQGISQAYLSMFPVLLSPALWEQSSNSTALVKLIEAYLCKAPEQLTSYTQGILGVFQKLVSARSSEINAFNLLRSFIAFMPMESYANMTGEIFKILLMRLQARMKGRMGIIYTKEFIYTVSVFIGKYGSAAFWNPVDALQPGTALNLVSNVWVNNALHVKDHLERKACVIAMTRMLVEVPQLQDPQQANAWSQILSVAVKLVEQENVSGDVSTKQPDAEDALEALEETGYEAGFSKLYFAASKQNDYLKGVAPSGKAFLVNELSKASAAKPGVYPQRAKASLQPAELAALEKYFMEQKAQFS